MRHQRRELGLNGSVMFVVRTDQNPVPVPATGFRWLNEQQHLTLEEVHGKPAEHSLGEEGPVLNKRLENPLMFECLHVPLWYDEAVTARFQESGCQRPSPLRPIQQSSRNISAPACRRTEGTSVNRRVVRERRQESPPWTAPSFRLRALYALLCGDEDRDSEKRADIGPFEQFQAADDGLLTDCTRVCNRLPGSPGNRGRQPGLGGVQIIRPRLGNHTSPCLREPRQ